MHFLKVKGQGERSWYIFIDNVLQSVAAKKAQFLMVVFQVSFGLATHYSEGWENGWTGSTILRRDTLAGYQHSEPLRASLG